MTDIVSVTVVQPDPVSVTAELQPVRAVTIGGLGPPGLPGAPGPAGAGGIEYPVNVPAANITVPHNLGRRPGSVAFYDTNDAEVETGVQVLDLNTILITMAAPLAGRVVVE